MFGVALRSLHARPSWLILLMGKGEKIRKKKSCLLCLMHWALDIAANKTILQPVEILYL
jgi:hypothetical protein